MAQTDSAELPESDTLSERAAGLVERDIIAGLHAPGARLGITDLVQRYEIGATPLREGLSRLLPSYMLPARWIVLDELPKNVNGKIDRTRLSRQRSQ